MSMETLIGRAVSPANDERPNFQRDLVALIPQTRALARALCGGRALADDMAQEALTRAWRARDSFVPGTNLRAWVFTILRNAISSHNRRSWREAEWDEDLCNQIPAPPREQETAIELSDTARALAGLTYATREALILVTVCGFTYNAAAAICDVPAGTIKSRVARGRAVMLSMLDGDEPIPRRSPKSRDPSGEILSLLHYRRGCGRIV
jgi:RNA polymerase sigma-70 factor (ECF subfamily)